MTLFLWIVIFCLSVTVLVKGADWFTESAEKIGLAFKISPFIIGVTVVALGTSLPELASSVAAALKKSTEIVPANAIGSNLANILLIIGLASVFGGTLIVRRSLIDLDLPLLASTTFLFIFCAWDRKITRFEALILVLAYLIYLIYTIVHRREAKEEADEIVEVLPSREERRKEEEKKRLPQKLGFKVFFFLVLGAVLLYFGADYVVESITKLAFLLNISSGVIAIIALAIGTSLPELVVSVRATLHKKYEIGLGNILGSNIFNILLVVGIPGLIRTLSLDGPTFKIGIPFLFAATLLFVVSGISRRIHIWEGAMYLLVYVMFIGMIFGLS